MNDLVPHGIRDERSNIRIHVGYANRKVYIFPTKEACQAVENKIGKVVRARQPGYEKETSVGRAVPMSAFHSLREYDIPDELVAKYGEKPSGLDERGRIAQETVAIMFPNMRRAGREEDLVGIDFVTPMGNLVQVKYDWACGPKPNGTGNFYIEEEEHNPHHLLS